MIKASSNNKNLEKDDLKALAGLKKKINDGKIMVIPTDKSGKMSVMTKDQYVSSMEPHYINEEEITLEDRKAIENNLNSHCVQLGRMIKVGENHKHEDRFKSALINVDAHIPTLYGMDKDHKHQPPGQPRKMRPVAGASESNNAQLSYLLAWIVNGIAEALDSDLQTVCKSTEELIAGFEVVNRRRDMVDMVLLSTDVSAMFPSLDIPEVARVVADEFRKSKFDIPLDHLEVGLYLATTVDRDELVRL